MKGLLLLVLISLAVFLGCSSTEHHYDCVHNADCPGGQICMDNRCVHNPGADVGIDLSLDPTTPKEATLAISGPETFGNVLISTSSELTYTLTNLGEKPAGEVKISGLAAPFQISTNNCTATVLSPCIFKILFSPTDTRSYSDKIEVTYLNSIGEAQKTELKIAGIGVDTVTLSFLMGEAFNFSEVVVGHAAAFKLWIQVGDELAANYVSGNALSAPFRYKGGRFPGTGGNCGSTSASLCSVVVEFAPTATGDFKRTLAVNYESTYATQTTASIFLEGKGVTSGYIGYIGRGVEGFQMDFNLGLHWNRGIGMDTASNLYVVEQNRMMKYSTKGLLLGWLGNGLDGFQNTGFARPGTLDRQFKNPVDVKIDLSGNIYVSDTHNQRIQKWDANGTYIGWLGGGYLNGSTTGPAPTSPGNGDGQFSYPTGLHFDSTGNLYIADHWNHRIQKWDSSGNYIGWLGSGHPTSFDTGSGANSGTGTCEFKNPFHVITDKNGSLYVSDTFNNRIQKWNADMTYVGWMGNGVNGWQTSAEQLAAGNGDCAFNSPIGMTIDASGFLYVADQGNNRVQKFNTEGTCLGWLGKGHNGSGFMTGDVPAEGFGSGEFSQPLSIAFDTHGNLYVSEIGMAVFPPQILGNRIQKFDPALLPLGWIGGLNQDQYQTTGYAPDAKSFEKYFRWPAGVTTDAAGNIYIASAMDCVIQKWAQNGTYLGFLGNGSKVFITGSYGSMPSMCGSGDAQFMMTAFAAFDPEKNFFVVDYLNHRIQKWDYEWNYVGWVGGNSGRFMNGTAPGRGSELGWFNQPAAIAFDAMGNFLVVEEANHRIQKFDPAGLALGWVGNGDAGWSIGNSTQQGSGDYYFNGPAGIAVDQTNGDFYVVDTNNSRVCKYDAEANFIGWIGKEHKSGFMTGSTATQGSGDGEFMTPARIALDSQGNIYVTDLKNFRIQKFDSDGFFKGSIGSGYLEFTSTVTPVDGAGDRFFYAPHGLFIDAHNYLYAGDLFGVVSLWKL